MYDPIDKAIDLTIQVCICQLQKLVSLSNLRALLPPEVNRFKALSTSVFCAAKDRRDEADSDAFRKQLQSMSDSELQDFVKGQLEVYHDERTSGPRPTNQN